MRTVAVEPLPLEPFEAVIGRRATARMLEAAGEGRELLGRRRVWNVNSTEQGGGVAEMLRSLLGYARGVGIDARWLVIEGSPEFFVLTKRLHNMLHNSHGDGSGLGERERELYESRLTGQGRELAALVEPGDVVLLHDPQTAGLAPALEGSGARVIWRLHIGMDEMNAAGHEAARFLSPYLRCADAYVFSRREYAWPELDPGKVTVIPPSIDAFSAKNQALGRGTVSAILQAAGLLDGAIDGAPTFTRRDGSSGRVRRRAVRHQDAVPHVRTPLVTQVSRWDRLKDHAGVMRGFAERVAPRSDAHLVLAGPHAEGVDDDPEGAAVLAALVEQRSALPRTARERVHLVSVPMEDDEENAAIVNALQRHARVVVQKSIAEGFGLTVTEAMWKGRPVLGTRVGGIQDQIVDGRTGFLLPDPTDLEGYAERLLALLDDPARSRRMGRAGKRRVAARFLGPRHLTQYLRLVHALDRTEASRAPAPPVPAS